jgi:ribosome-binding protein aMBF1 (putative translation factor)
MEHQDWKDFTWNKTGEKGKNQSDKSYIMEQKRKGNTVVISKNVNNKHDKSDINMRVLEKEEDTFKLPTISLNMSKKIALARCDKKLTQKELAFKLNLDVKIIQEYESGKGIPNSFIINKIEKILGTKLR